MEYDGTVYTTVTEQSIGSILMWIDIGFLDGFVAERL